jgi:hypothetical protein
MCSHFDKRKQLTVMLKRTRDPSTDQPIVAQVNSEDISKHIKDLAFKHVQTLIINVDGGWEDNLPPAHFNLESLKELVLQSEISKSSSVRTATIPNPLKQWMPQLHTLDISNLEHYAIIKEVYNTFPTQSIVELKLGSFGLMYLWEFAMKGGKPDLLNVAQSIHCTFNSMFTSRTIDWLREWAVHQTDQHTHSLTMIFPRWDEQTHKKMRMFVQMPHIQNQLFSVKHLHVLDIRILNVDNLTETDENRFQIAYTCPFAWFQGRKTATKFSVRVKNMGVLIANWLDLITMSAPAVAAASKMNVQLDFTHKWSGFNETPDNVRDVVQNTIKLLVDRQLSRWEMLVLPANYYKHRQLYDRNNMIEAKRLGMETKLSLTMHTPAQFISTVSQLVDITMDNHQRKHLYDRLLENGYIEHKIKSKR